MGRCVSVFFVERRVSVRINGGYEEVEFGWNRMKCGREQVRRFDSKWDQIMEDFIGNIRILGFICKEKLLQGINKYKKLILGG